MEQTPSFKNPMLVDFARLIFVADLSLKAFGVMNPNKKVECIWLSRRLEELLLEARDMLDGKDGGKIDPT